MLRHFHAGLTKSHMIRRAWLQRSLMGLGAIATPSPTSSRSGLTGVEPFGDVITVTAYGARGDGIADDHRPIQLDLAEAEQRSARGRVPLPGGLYSVGARLLLP